MSQIAKISLSYLEEEVRPFLKNPLILDSGPLVFLLVGLCDPSSKNKNIIWDGQTREELELLISLVRQFKEVIITPQILAECTNLLNRNRNTKEYQHILSQIIKPLMQFGETYIEKDVILSYSEFSRFGSTDIGIVECSKKNNSLIITQDSSLQRFCQGNKIPCINFNNLRPSTWK